MTLVILALIVPKKHSDRPVTVRTEASVKRAEDIVRNSLSNFIRQIGLKMGH